MGSFKVDDRVKINPESEYQNQAPDGMEGIIIEYDTDTNTGYFYRVRWSKGGRNDYRCEDLILIGGEPPI